MFRFLFRAFWRLMYLNPQYLRYSGAWDCQINDDGMPIRLTDKDFGLWLERFKDQWFLYRHPEYQDW